MASDAKEYLHPQSRRRLGHIAFNLLYALLLTGILQAILLKVTPNTAIISTIAVQFLAIYLVNTLVISRLTNNKPESVLTLAVRTVTTHIFAFLAGLVTIELNLYNSYHSISDLVGVIAFAPLIGYMEMIRSYQLEPALIFRDASYFELEDLEYRRRKSLPILFFFLSSAVVPLGSAYLWTLLYIHPSQAELLSEALFGYLVFATMLQILIGAFTAGRYNLFLAFFLMFSLQLAGLFMAFFAMIGLD